MRIIFRITLFCLVLGITPSLYTADFPREEGWVSDYANVIDPQSKSIINAVSTELEQKTSAEVAVVTIKTLPEEAIETFAVDLFQKWGIGKKDKDNGILLLAAIEDKKVRIEVGYGLEGILPDGKCGSILDQYVIPYFKTGQYSEGLKVGLIVIASIIAEDSGVKLTGNIGRIQRVKKNPTVLGTIFKILFFFAMVFLFIKHPRLFILLLLLGMGRGGGGGGGFGGFGGFGGGMSGGGGASRGW